MPKKKYFVTLSKPQREQLEQLLRGGKHPTRQIIRARILLKAAQGCKDGDIAEALCVGRATVERTRRRFADCGLKALTERARPGQTPKLDHRGRVRLIAEACSTAPEGRKRWTLQLLADRVVALGLAESYSYESVRRVLKKTASNRG